MSLVSGPSRAFDVARSELRQDDTTLVTFAWYDVGGHVTGSPWMAKARTAWQALTGHHNQAAVVALQARYGPGGIPVPEPELRAFVARVVEGVRGTIQELPRGGA